MNSSGVAVEEPISSELVLVDEELARRARGALPDPPWLLPVLAELDEVTSDQPAVAVQEPPAAVEAAEPAPAPSRRRVPRSLVVALVLCALAALAYVLHGLLPTPQGPTLAARPEPKGETPAATSTGTTGPPAPTPTQPSVTPKARPNARHDKPKSRPKSRAAVPPSKPAKPKAKPRPRTLTRAQRVFGWRRYPGALYYQLYLQRGGKTIFETRTLRPKAELPARLTVQPGTYKVLVRPAVPSDAGIILGAAIYGRTVRA